MMFIAIHCQNDCKRNDAYQDCQDSCKMWYKAYNKICSESLRFRDSVKAKCICLSAVSANGNH